MTTFRLAKINVHSFCRLPSFSSNVSELISILEPFNLDIIAVQEVQNNDKWKEFYQRLSLPFSVYGPSNGTCCNGIASRYPIRCYSVQETSFCCIGGYRSILQCCLDTIENVTFAVTHLDYLDEDDQLKQIKEFNPYEHNIEILMGDMNALTREDYSDDYYHNIVVERREKSNWEKPRFELTQLITHERNYQDAF
ncbi:unnamed protein product [Rotaria sp. Silwood1]|nr:unnamed protein product [Rotaria sp. Silwood1]CAF3830994.1 unnamed protein product [Rotaria sp. Silwood1]CAF3887516.1 unnamed protein product [Rotaria sp. Silwood1]CAF4900972.1 unnamed protein product [Rotaria sp. Silwood1]CAF4943027.1 unnamed protein product [Rotaria sp. Silwood1]